MAAQRCLRRRAQCQTGTGEELPWIKLRSNDPITDRGTETITVNTELKSTGKGHTLYWQNTPGTGAQQLHFVAFDGNGTPPVRCDSGANIIRDTEWHHVAVVGRGFDNSQPPQPRPNEFYVDGSNDPGATCSSLSPPGTPMGKNIDLQIGGFPSTSFDRSFDGQIDELEIFSRDLTAAEIQSIYHAGKAGKCEGSTCNDVDRDGYGSPPSLACPKGLQNDCDDTPSTGSSVWAPPGEVQNLALSPDRHTLQWDPVIDGGATSVWYDTIRSQDPGDFMSDPTATCINRNDPATTTVDQDLPQYGTVFYYLVRAENSCPGSAGTGTLGTDVDGVTRAGLLCP